MYLFCVIIPLIIANAIIFNSIYTKEYNNRIHELDNIASKYISTIDSSLNYNTRIARAISGNQQLNSFLNKKYKNLNDYYEKYYDFVNKSYFQSLVNLVNDRSGKIMIYVDNPTIFESSTFKQMSKIKDKEWYKRYVESGLDECLLVFYDDSAELGESRKRFMFIKKMQSFDSSCEKIIRVDMNSEEIRNQLLRISKEYKMYVCCDDYVAFTQYGTAILNIKIDNIKEEYKIMSHKEYSAYGTKLDVYLFSNELLLNSVILANRWIIIFLLLFTLVIPILVMKIIEESLTMRIVKLGDAFNGSQVDKFQPISSVEGNDEISALMYNYNNIVSINKDLINSLYKDKLKERENDLSRKNAELLALQSQINPHFLFNSLESIRMHSILKGEEETAEMVEKLALMTRQNVEWGNDLVTVKKETESIEAYLYLQSYRFGDRLSFDVDVEKSCEDYLIPKLTLVTFVENACVHGIESKSSAGWIFVRVYQKDVDLCMEIEDTGGGMTDQEIENLLQSIESVSIDQIKGKKHVGILNACLRLKIHTNNDVTFSIDSEVGVGMCVLIRIPIKRLRRNV